MSNGPSLASLPLEIIEQILYCLGKSYVDLAQCQLICKRWSQVAQAQLYMSIDFSSSQFSRTNSNNMHLFFRTIIGLQPSPASLVKSLTLTDLLWNYFNGKKDWIIRGGDANNNIINYLYPASTCFPNLKRLYQKKEEITEIGVDRIEDIVDN